MRKTPLFLSFVLFLILAFILTGCSGPAVKKAKNQDRTVKGPALTITEPAPNLETDQTEVTVKGKTEPGSKLKLDGVSKELQTDGAFSFVVQLVRGMNRFIVESTNKAGGSTEREIVVNCIAQSQVAEDTGVQTQQSTRTGDTSTPQSTLLGHWRSQQYTVIEEKTDWYFNSSRVIARVGSDPNNIQTFDDNYTVVSANQETFKMTIRVQISGGATEDLKIAFSMDRWRMTITEPDGDTISCYLIDEKQQP